MSIDIIREDPPATSTDRRGSQLHNEIAEKLKADPDNWYRVAEGEKNSQLATRIAKAAIKAYRPAGDFEAVARSVDGTFSVWARYVGEYPDE